MVRGELGKERSLAPGRLSLSIRTGYRRRTAGAPPSERDGATAQKETAPRSSAEGPSCSASGEDQAYRVNPYCHETRGPPCGKYVDSRSNTWVMIEISGISARKPLKTGGTRLAKREIFSGVDGRLWITLATVLIRYSILPVDGVSTVRISWQIATYDLTLRKI